jgi:hypothetical protein
LRFRDHTDTLHSVGLLWTRDRLDTETSTWQHTALTGERHACRRRDLNSQFQEASGLRQRGQRTRPLQVFRLSF